MEPYKIINKKNIILLLGTIILITLCYILFDNLVFRVKYTSPSLDRVPDSAVEIRYHFSQPLKSVEKVMVGEKEIYDASIDGNVLKIPLGSTLESNTEYEIKIEKVNSKWFENKLDSISDSFTPTYIEFDSLSEEEKSAQINTSNSGQVNDAFIATNTFPIFNDRWQIDATVIEGERSVVLNVKFFEEIPDYDNGGKITPLPNSVAEKYRNEILESIRQDGGDPSKYIIVYLNTYLNDKYSKKSHD